MLIDSQSWYASRGVWSGAAVVVSTIVAATTGVTISDADVKQAVDIGCAIVDGIGGLLAIYYRIVATRKIA